MHALIAQPPFPSQTVRAGCPPRRRETSFFPQAGNCGVEAECDACTERPADSPSPTDARKAEQGREDKHESDAQDEVGEGAHHKSHVSVAAAHRAVRHDLDIDGEKEECGDADELRARRERECIRSLLRA